EAVEYLNLGDQDADQKSDEGARQKSDQGRLERDQAVLDKESRLESGPDRGSDGERRRHEIMRDSSKDDHGLPQSDKSHRNEGLLSPPPSFHQGRAHWILLFDPCRTLAACSTRLSNISVKCLRMRAT